MAELRRLPLVWASGAVAIVLISACSNGRAVEPQSLPRPVQPSRMPSSLKSKPPVELSAADAIGFVRSYYAAITRAADNGDTRTLDQMISSGCPCRAVAGYIRDAYEKGSLRGFTYHISEVRVDDYTPHMALLSVFYSVDQISEVGRYGRILKRIPAVASSQKAVTLIQEHNHWVVWSVHNFQD